MIQLTVDCLKFNALALTGAPHGAFELMQFGSGNTATSIARIEVEHAHLPTLKVTRLDPQERFIDSRAAATADRVVLAHWRDSAPKHYELSVAHLRDGMQTVLSVCVVLTLFRRAT